MRLLVFISLFISHAGLAHAHIGHLGELAGHGHWIALGAGITAAALAALIAKHKNSQDKSEEKTEEEASGEEEAPVANLARTRPFGV